MILSFHPLLLTPDFLTPHSLLLTPYFLTNRLDGGPGPGALDPVHHHPLIALQPLLDHPHLVFELPHGDGALFDDILGVDHEQIPPALISPQSPFGHQERMFSKMNGNPDAHEHAGENGWERCPG